MATTIKSPNKGPHKTRPARSSASRKKGQLTAGQRWKRRFLYTIKHPLDFLWGWLSSVRTAILLIVAIALICLLGVYIVQAPGEVLNDAATYSTWVQQNELPRYGSLTPVYDWLQFFKIFSSWYFMLLLTILSLSIVVCTLNRAPSIWQNFAHPLIRRNDNFYQNALERSEFSHPNAVAWIEAALRKRRYGIRKVVEQDKPEETVYLYADKNSWATLSTFVFHAALVTLLMAGVLSVWHGFAPNSLARRILPAPIVALTDNFAGLTFDQALPDGESAVVYPRGTPHNISFRANSFIARFDPTTGLPTDYVTDLSVYKDGELVAHSNHLRVNDPLAYGGIVFHQSSLLPSVHITITDTQGNVIYNDAVVLDQTETLPSGKVVDLGEGIPVSDTNLTLSAFFVHDPSLQLAQVANPSILIAIGAPGSDAAHKKVLLSLTPDHAQLSTDKEWLVKLDSASEATVLLVTKDTGAQFVWPVAVILIFSLCTTFYFPQRRIWIRIRGAQVQMAALHEHFTNIRTDLLGISREAIRK